MIKKTWLLLFTLLSLPIFSQNDIKIEFINETTVLLNEKKIDKNTAFNELIEVLGEPVVYKEYVTGKVNYHYKENGITLQTVDNKLLMLGFNYNWDGDKTFPETSFKGKLIVDKVEYDENSNEKILDNIKEVEFITVMSGFYISKPKTEKKNTFIMIGFKNDKVTQVGFEFH